MKLKPFFMYYGAKARLAPKYPQPRYSIIVEPFAGAAGYSLLYPDRQVILVEKDPRVAELWHYLIGATPEEIMAIPLMGPEESLDDPKFGGLPSGAISLVGFWLNVGSGGFRKRPTKWMRWHMVNSPNGASTWGAAVRARVAEQVGAIKHWKIIDGDYHEAPDVEATWFFDPPYAEAGKHYKYNQIDFSHLANVARSARGQVIVCEQEGASWLPFEPLTVAQGGAKHPGRLYTEVIWTNDQEAA